jgi:YD repeat-containing protein
MIKTTDTVVETFEYDATGRLIKQTTVTTHEETE